MSATCPHCGGAISVLLTANPSASSDATLASANPASNGRIAQMVLGSKPPTKDGRQAYNQDYPQEFEDFWSIYPKHRDKRKALKAWRNAIRRAAIPVINAGAIRYRNDPNRLDEFTKYAEGWLNGDCWLDDPLPARGRDQQAEEHDRARERKLADAHRFIEEERRVR